MENRIAGRHPTEWGAYLAEHATRYGEQGVPTRTIRTAGQEAMTQALRDMQEELEAGAQELQKQHSDPKAMERALRRLRSQVERRWQPLVEERIQQAMHGALKTAWGRRDVPLQAIRGLHHEEPDPGKPAPDQMRVHAQIGDADDRERLLKDLTPEQRDVVRGLFPKEGLTVQALAERLDRPVEDVHADMQKGKLEVEMAGVPMTFGLGDKAPETDEIHDALDEADKTADNRTADPVDEPEQIGDEPEQIGDEPEQIGAEPEQIGAEPEQISAEPARISGEPEQISGEPERISAQPAQISGEPARISAEPDRLSQIATATADSVGHGQPDDLGSTDGNPAASLDEAPEVEAEVAALDLDDGDWFEV